MLSVLFDTQPSALHNVTESSFRTKKTKAKQTTKPKKQPKKNKKEPKPKPAAKTVAHAKWSPEEDTFDAQPCAMEQEQDWAFDIEENPDPYEYLMNESETHTDLTEGVEDVVLEDSDDDCSLAKFEPLNHRMTHSPVMSIRSKTPVAKAPYTGPVLQPEDDSFID